MPTVRPRAVRPPETRRGFTLIELLVVIAIIAILAALLFPVFAKVREKARQTTVISNLHQISLGLAQYQLDYHKYPDVLFGYANSATSMANYTPPAGARPALFPNYVKDYRVFMDPNNNADPSTVGATASAPVLGLAADGKTLTALPNQMFYTADAYDISPEVTGPDAVSPTTYVPRYQLNWTSINGNTAPTGVDQSDYQRQMRWRSVPGDTYVTCSTYHVQQAGKVIVLFESGPAKILDTTRFIDPSTTGPDVASLSVNGNVANANFWKIRP